MAFQTLPFQPNVAPAASLIADPARAAMMAALMDGNALPAGELAYAAGITAQTASSHLGKLLARLLAAFCAAGWLQRSRDSRAVQVTPKGKAALKEQLGVTLDA
jgi:DNA-binding transcriptional ArsR family regulator